MEAAARQHAVLLVLSLHAGEEMGLWEQQPWRGFPAQPLEVRPLLHLSEQPKRSDVSNAGLF